MEATLKYIRELPTNIFSQPKYTAEVVLDGVVPIEELVEDTIRGQFLILRKVSRKEEITADGKIVYFSRNSFIGSFRIEIYSRTETPTPSIEIKINAQESLLFELLNRISDIAKVDETYKRKLQEISSNIQSAYSLIGEEMGWI